MWFQEETEHNRSTYLVDTRTKLKQSTFTAFVDFKKAYDFINRDKLWKRLFESGISGKMLNAIISLYKYVSSCVFELIHLKRNGLVSILVCDRDVFCHLCYLTYTTTTWQTILKA